MLHKYTRVFPLLFSLQPFLYCQKLLLETGVLQSRAKVNGPQKTITGKEFCGAPPYLSKGAFCFWKWLARCQQGLYSEAFAQSQAFCRTLNNGGIGRLYIQQKGGSPLDNQAGFVLLDHRRSLLWTAIRTHTVSLAAGWGTRLIAEVCFSV